MNHKKQVNPLPKLIIWGVMFFSLLFTLSCQKENTKPLLQNSLIQSAKQSFENQINGIGLTKSLFGYGDTLSKKARLSQSRVPLWSKSTIKNFSTGEGVVIPLAYSNKIGIRLGKQNNLVPIDSLSYMILFKDKNNQFQINIITKIPDDESWDNRHTPGNKFHGLILVEDWWGNPIKSMYIAKSGEVKWIEKEERMKTITSGNSNVKTDSYVAQRVCYPAIWEITIYVEGNEPEVYYEAGQYCETQYIYINDGPSAGDLGGGGGYPQGGGGSSGSTTTFVYSDINNQVSNFCLKNVVNGLKNANMAGKVAEIITALDQNSRVQANIIDQETTTDGKPANTTALSYDNNTGLFKVTIILNRSSLIGTTRENVGTVIVHELIHAYMNYMGKVPKLSETIEHATMANIYVTPMASFLSNLYGISSKDATALAWSGLANAASYINSSSFTYQGGTMSKEELGHIYGDYITKFSGVPACPQVSIEE
jgi:hypothetical protein